MRNAADDAVSRGEKGRERRRTRRILGNDRALFGNLRQKPRILARIGDIDAAAEHGDRRARLQSALVRGRVDAARRAAHDDKTALGKTERDVLRRPLAIGARVACADHSDGGMLQAIERATAKERLRRIVDLLQQSGIRLI